MSTRIVNSLYQDDASINATLLLQKQIFQLQSDCLSQMTAEFSTSNIAMSDDLKFPQFIGDRVLLEDYASHGRKLDNEEITLLGILDSSGKISVSSRLNEFMLFMTRIKKVWQNKFMQL